MNSISIVYIALLMLISARVEALELSCNDPRNPANEAKLIRKLANGVVQRLSKNRLLIQTKSVEFDLENAPPLDKSQKGIRHFFCDRKEGYVLISVANEDDLSGDLINEATGKIMQAGETVLFSQDKRAYLAISHSEMNGSEWNIYSADGRLSWSGYGFILAANSDWTEEAYLKDPTWTARGELTATASCVENANLKWQVKLIKSGKKWEWHPKPSTRCRRG